MGQETRSGPGPASADRDAVRRRLAAHPVAHLPAEGLRRAAVTVALVTDEVDRVGLVLCQRGHVGSHRGQFGLPGGSLDVGEEPAEAALRELEEEVALTGEVLGRLDDYTTRSGFHLTPFVVWCGRARPRLASPVEIRAVHVVPVDDVRPDSPEWIPIPESDRPVLLLHMGPHHVYAPTAAIIHQFGEVGLRGRPTRVVDAEEPVFAWR